jgi:hypothetical protein
LKAVQKSKIALEIDFEIKQIALPMLGRSGNMQQTEGKSMIEEIIEKHERLKASKARRHLKILQL